MAAFPDIKSKHSLVAKHVTKEKWDKLSGITTKTSGFTLAKAIACAVEFDNQHCGIYAGDEDSYADFADVFDPLICEYHGLPAGFAHQSDMDSSKITGNVEPDVPVHSARYDDDKFTKKKSKAAFFFSFGLNYLICIIKSDAVPLVLQMDNLSYFMRFGH